MGNSFVFDPQIFEDLEREAFRDAALAATFCEILH